MLTLNQIKPKFGSTHSRKRVGRGIGSGHGKTSCKGGKGQTARSGGKVGRGFEGGQTPMQRRLPKRGFVNIFRKNWAIVTTGDLNRFNEKTVVTLEELKRTNIIKASENVVGLKVILKGELKKSLTIKAQKVTAGAAAAIEKAGGRIEA